MATNNTNIWLLAALGVGGYLWFKNQAATATDPATGATATPATPVAGPSNLTTQPPVISTGSMFLPPIPAPPTPPVASLPVNVPVNQLNNPLPTAAQIAAQGVNVTNGNYVDLAANVPANYDSDPVATHGSSIPPQFQSGVYNT